MALQSACALLGITAVTQLPELRVQDLRKKFRRQSLKCHPDKVREESKKAEAEERFKSLVAAAELIEKTIDELKNGISLDSIITSAEAANRKNGQFGRSARNSNDGTSNADFANFGDNFNAQPQAPKRGVLRPAGYREDIFVNTDWEKLGRETWTKPFRKGKKEFEKEGEESWDDEDMKFDTTVDSSDEEDKENKSKNDTEVKVQYIYGKKVTVGAKNNPDATNGKNNKNSSTKLAAGTNGSTTAKKPANIDDIELDLKPVGEKKSGAEVWKKKEKKICEGCAIT